MAWQLGFKIMKVEEYFYKESLSTTEFVGKQKKSLRPWFKKESETEQLWAFRHQKAPKSPQEMATKINEIYIF